MDLPASMAGLPVINARVGTNASLAASDCSSPASFGDDVESVPGVQLDAVIGGDVAAQIQEPTVTDGSIEGGKIRLKMHEIGGNKAGAGDVRWTGAGHAGVGAPRRTGNIGDADKSDGAATGHHIADDGKRVGDICGVAASRIDQECVGESEHARAAAQMSTTSSTGGASATVCAPAVSTETVVAARGKSIGESAILHIGASGVEDTTTP